MNRCAGLFCSLILFETAGAAEWGPIELTVDSSSFHFDITAFDVSASQLSSTLSLYPTAVVCLMGGPNYERFTMTFTSDDGAVTEPASVETIGIPDRDYWLDGPVAQFSLTESEPGTWRFTGRIDNGPEPYVAGDQLGCIRLDMPGLGIVVTDKLIASVGEPSMTLTKTTNTRVVYQSGEAVHYLYRIENTGAVTLHDVALDDNNVDSPPVCAFSGGDQLSPEGEFGSIVLCTAQHILTPQEIAVGGTLDNTATATSDETEPVTASLSIPIVLFIDSFETPANTITILDNVASDTGRNNSIAIGGDGLPVIAYFDPSNQQLKVAKCTSELCTAAFISVVDELADSYPSLSMTIAPDGLPVISYADAAQGSLKVAKCNDAACSGGDENISVVDNRAVSWTSIAIGTDNLPVISYQDAAISKLMVAKCNDLACGGGDETISTLNDLAQYTGGQTSITVPADGLPVISYKQLTGAPMPSYLMVAKCNDVACTGADETISQVAETGIAMFESTAITIAEDGLPLIAFFDSGDGAVMVVKCNDSACTNDDEVENFIDDSTGQQQVSVAIGPDGRPVVAYNGTLRVARCDDLACTGGNATISQVDPVPYVAWTSVAIGIDGLPIISYFESTNPPQQLKVVHCSSAGC